MNRLSDPLSLRLLGTGALTLGGIHRPARETYLSLLFSAEVNSEWIYTSTPQYVFMACTVSLLQRFQEH